MALLLNARAIAADTVWVEDSLPAGAWGAAAGGDAWTWVSANPAPFSGSKAHQSQSAPGVHYHYFSGASATSAVATGDVLITYVYLDPANPPRELMLQWFDGSSWAHAAYWGENLIPWGTDGTASQMPMGGLPPAGQWVRLEVPASVVDLEGRSLLGMDFILYDGSATWDFSGKSDSSNPPPPGDTTPPTIAMTSPANGSTVSGSSVTVSASASDDVGVVGVQFKLDGANLGAEKTAAPYSVVWDTTTVVNGSHTLTAVARDAAGNQSTSAPVTVNVSNSAWGSDVVWLEDAIPVGAYKGTYGGDKWTWVSGSPTPYSGRLAHQSANVSGAHYHYFSGATATLPVSPGDVLFTSVFIDPAHPPRQIMMQWFDGSSWSHAAYWGSRYIAFGTEGTPSQQPMGILPSYGNWMRLEVPARLVGLEGRTLSGMNFILYDGRVTWDYTGRLASSNPGSWLDDANSVHYPDLQTMPPVDLMITNDTTVNQKLLRFSNWTVNRGTGPLDVIPVNNSTAGTTDAYQRLYSHDANGNWYVVSTQYVGQFVFHPQHNHWHFEGFSRYELRNTASDGSIGSTVLAENSKVSSCLRDSALADARRSHVQPFTYEECSDTAPQGLSVGWADVYTWDLFGQSLDITGLPDGDYWLLSTCDPDNLLNEGGGSAESNGRVALKIRIQGTSVYSY